MTDLNTGPAEPPRASGEPEGACPIATFTELVSGRWAALILWTLHTCGRQRFVELERRVATISPKVLTERLRQLERGGLLLRTYYPEVPPRAEYELTELGRSLAPIFGRLVEWSHEHLDAVQEARTAYDARQ